MKAGSTACAVASEKPKSQTKTSYAYTGMMATPKANEEDMELLEQIVKKPDGLSSKPRATAKSKGAVPPPAQIAKGTTPPPNKSKVQVQVRPKVMEIHFYKSEFSVPSGVECRRGWVETEQAILERKPHIVTTQMGLLSTNLLEKGYLIFVHPIGDGCYEIQLGENTCTDRQIAMKSNLFKLWAAGEFSV